MLKAIVNGAEKDIVRIPMLGDGPATVTGTNSVTFETDATSVIDYTIKGNLQQSGTPSPSSPIYPSETGDRTENILSINSTGDATGITATVTSDGNGVVINGTAEGATRLPTLSYIYFDTGTYTLTGCPKNSGITIDVRELTGSIQISGSSDSGNGAVFQINEAQTLRIVARVPNGTTVNNLTIYPMVTKGSTIPADYEPYGYKLPYSINSVSQTPIYLQEPIRKIGDYVDVTGLSIGGANRKIKKMVLTGNEIWSFQNGAAFISNTNFPSGYELPINQSPLVCSHFRNFDGYGGMYNGNSWKFICPGTYFRDENDAKAFFAAQYSAGTPVTVWYVLAEPETETASMPTITTAKGSNTLSIGTTLSPSSTEVTYLGIKNTYKEGWEIRDQQDRLIWGYNSTISGASPLSFKGGGTALTDILIGGNMVQSGTPSPASPIYPSETGERTENLFDALLINGIIDGDTGAASSGAVDNRVYSNFIKVIPSAEYTIDFLNSSEYSIAIYSYGYDFGYNKSESIKTWRSLPISFSFANSYNIRIYIKRNDENDFTPESISNIMLNSGSTAKPYEPYGYKLPLTCGNSASNIYLQEPIRKIGDHADAAGLSIGGANRRIRKLVLDGTEEIGVHTIYNYYVYCKLSSSTGYAIENVNICSHFPAVRISVSNTSQGFGVQNKTDPSGTYVLFRWDSVPMTASGFKQWLSDQYSAGTPVTVWYVLTEPETETATIPTITTEKGSNTLSIGTSLQPSSVSITGHIKASS